MKTNLTHSKVCGNCNKRRLVNDHEKPYLSPGQSVCDITGNAVSDHWQCIYVNEFEYDNESTK